MSDVQIKQIYHVMQDPFPDHDLAVMKTKEKIEVKYLEQGSYLKFQKEEAVKNGSTKIIRYKKPTKDQKCDFSIDYSIAEQMDDKRMHYDQEIVKRLGYTCKDIATRVFDLVQHMEEKIKIGQGYNISRQAERTIQTILNPRNFTAQLWTGFKYLHYLPEIKSGWSLSHEQQAIVENNHYCISRVVWMGAQECPFQKSDDETYYGYRYGNHDIVITNLITNETVAISSLTLHMISNHGCFQNSKNKYRLHPKKLIRVLF